LCTSFSLGVHFYRDKKVVSLCAFFRAPLQYIILHKIIQKRHWKIIWKNLEEKNSKTTSNAKFLCKIDWYYFGMLVDSYTIDEKNRWTQNDGIMLSFFWIGFNMYSTVEDLWNLIQQFLTIIAFKTTELMIAPNKSTWKCRIWILVDSLRCFFFFQH
jgi:hypothetical protein